MKVILIAVLLNFAIGLKAQQKTEINLPIDTTTGKIVFSEVVQVDSTNKEKIFELLRTWASTTTLIKEKNITVADKESYEITMSCKDPILYNDANFSTNFCFINYSITFYIKDNKFKYFIRNFSHEGCQRGGNFGVMKSIGELENVIVVQREDRGYYDNVLRLVKEQTLKIIEAFKSATKINIKEKDF